MKQLIILLVINLVLATINSNADGGLDKTTNPKHELTQSQRQLQQNELTQKRIYYHDLIRNAYLKYPILPSGLLESIAYVSSRWNHRLPISNYNHNGMPQSYGIFGLYHSNEFGFMDSLTLIADHSQRTVAEILDDEALYINATAFYISAQLKALKIDSLQIENSKSIIAKLSGIKATSNVSQYAKNSFVYDVFMTLKKGFKLEGVELYSQKIELSKVFTTKELSLLATPELLINQQKDIVKPVHIKAQDTKSKKKQQ